MIWNRTRPALAGLMIFLGAMISPPVRGERIVADDGRLVMYDSGVVYDPETYLEWFEGPDRPMSWEEARNWVANLDAVGGNWRMPTHGELKGLYNLGDGINNISMLLYNSGFWIWAGQTRDAASRWIFSFSYGGEGWNGEPPDDGGRAIAVRDLKR